MVIILPDQYLYFWIDEEIQCLVKCNIVPGDTGEREGYGCVNVIMTGAFIKESRGIMKLVHDTETRDDGEVGGLGFEGRNEV